MTQENERNERNERSNGSDRKQSLITIALIAGVVLLLLIFGMMVYNQFAGDKENKVTVNENRATLSQTETTSPAQDEAASSAILEDDLSGLQSSGSDDVKVDKPVTKSTGIKGGVFRYQGKPDLSITDYDFGIYLTPVTVGSNEYVPIKFITKSYIKKLVPQISGLKENSVPMTDKKDPEGRPPGKAWNVDKSGTAYYFVDFGQKVKRTGNNSDVVTIPLNAYAGQKPGGYEIWLMYEAAVLNKQGFTQHWDGGNFISNGDGGYDYGARFSGFKSFN
jgi:hypothetical protein